MSNRVSDEELERALAELAQREAEVDASEVDEQSQVNLRRWVDAVRREIQTDDGKSDRP
jgi:hypothetical protein